MGRYRGGRRGAGAASYLCDTKRLLETLVTQHNWYAEWQPEKYGKCEQMKTIASPARKGGFAHSVGSGWTSGLPPVGSIKISPEKRNKSRVEKIRCLSACAP